MDDFEDIAGFIATLLLFALGVALFAWLYPQLPFGTALLAWMFLVVIGALFLSYPIMAVSAACAGAVVFMDWLFTRLSRRTRS
jgi:hypothetical protein